MRKAGVGRHFGSLLVAFALGLSTIAPAAAPTAASVDAIFARYTAATPGCAVGIDNGEDAPILRAYGSADLEHGVASTTESIFEAGSASKQFTAASILILASQGRLALSDDVRRYIPELPDYGTSITIAELLGHTSGLRDWGEVEDIAGWSRGERVYSLNDVLRITSAQKHLNFTPGTAWSYTNTGYNLAAIIVQRVSGQTLPEFSHDHFFLPLGMTHTSWRDDFRRIVPGRAIAYSSGEHGLQQDMPFENAYGNGGLLTTVGDLLIWNRALSQRKLGAYVTDELQRRTTLADGRSLDYARGLFDQTYGGFREVGHPGATAGYRAWVARYPDQSLSIALLCNDGDSNPVKLGHAVADLFLPSHPTQKPLSQTEEAKLASTAGWYVDLQSNAPLQLSTASGWLRSDAGLIVQKSTSGQLLLGDHPIAFRPTGEILLDEGGATETYHRVGAFAPDSGFMASLAGRYRSDEADATYDVTLHGARLQIRSEQRPDLRGRLIPAFQDAFLFGDELVQPVRNNMGRVVGLTISSSRVWKLVLTRIP